MQSENGSLHASSIPHRLALLVAAPHGAETAMHDDLVSIYNGLRLRWLLPVEILTLEGKLNRELLMVFLHQAGKSVINWSHGEVFLYYSGHGNLSTDALGTRAGMLLTSNTQSYTDDYVLWDEVFAALALPPKVSLVILPDS